MTCSDQEIAGDYCSGMESHYRDFLEILEERNALYRIVFSVEDILLCQQRKSSIEDINHVLYRMRIAYKQWKEDFDSGRKKRT